MLETGDIMEITEAPDSGTGLLLLTSYTDDVNLKWWKCVIVNGNKITGVIKDVLEQEIEKSFIKINARILNESARLKANLPDTSVLKRIM